ncbi:hypothetical protein [Butyrivibrio sp. NC3005]|uniref:hypothetical protein n=1 Tax=Butyrivibrio sp. NC3005 TaxID=1280685 RepID=UPI0003FE4C57|nr:hypothetical protein [Butyrivibrio sp. NC3005]
MNTVLFEPQNEEIQIQLRRHQDALALSGGMVIVMSLWDIIKLFITFFLGEESISKLIEIVMNQSGADLIGTEYEQIVNIILWIFFLLILFLFSGIVFLYHLYIGLNAFRAGRSTAKKRNKFYLVVTLFSALFTGVLILSNIFNCIRKKDMSGNIDLAYFIMEVTAFINYVSILYSSNKIKSLKKQEA